MLRSDIGKKGPGRALNQGGTKTKGIGRRPCAIRRQGGKKNALVGVPDLESSLAIARRLARRLSGEFDLTSIGEAVVTALTAELGLHSCSVMWLDQVTGRLVNVAGSGSRAGTDGGCRTFGLGEGIAGLVAREAKTIRVHDASRDRRFLDRSDAVRSLLCFPLVSGDQVLGVLNLSHPDRGFFTKEHEAVFGVLSMLVGHLIAFAELKAELAELNRSLEEKVELKTRETEAAQQRVFQQEKLAALGTMVAGVAHELNNSLVPLVAYSHMLKDSARHGEDRRLLASIAHGADAAKGIVESLLRFARPDSLQLGVVDCNAIVSEVTDHLPQRASRPTVELRTFIADDPTFVLGDAGKISQVLVNLINNGYDAISDSGIIEVRTRTRGADIELQVQDSGPGIPRQNISRIFDPFFTTKDVGRGTGLGLSLCYGMIRAHRGEIDVETQPGRTVFTVRLPVAASSTEGVRTGARGHG